MFEIAALTYGLLASFVVNSATRNKREARDNPMILMVLAWVMLSFSAATGALLLGYAGLRAAGVA